MQNFKEVLVRGDMIGCELKIGDRVEITGLAPDYKHITCGNIVDFSTLNKDEYRRRIFDTVLFTPKIKLDNGAVVEKYGLHCLWKKMRVKKELRNLWGLLIKDFYQPNHISMLYKHPIFIEAGD
jgi:hypothetical protein